MEHVIGSNEPQPFELFVSKGELFARVRKNIGMDTKDAEEGMESYDFWEWDEYVFPALDEGEDYMIENADSLDAAYSYSKQRQEMTESAWRADVDQAILDLTEMAVM